VRCRTGAKIFLKNLASMKSPNDEAILSVSPRILSNAMRLARPCAGLLASLFLQRHELNGIRGRIGLGLRKISRVKSTASERKLRAVVCACSWWSLLGSRDS
jgi:hypothetical protein